MGRRSLSLWPQWLAELSQPVFYRDNGTLLLWHREDAGEAHRFERLLAARDAQAHLILLDAARLNEMEPGLDSRLQQSLYLPGEAQIDNRALLKALAIAIEGAGVRCRWQILIEGDALPAAGMVVDCRGMGARRDLPRLRGVRGEIVRLDAPNVELRHMLRLLHPRYSVYVVPRGQAGCRRDQH
jgi:glycine oxidase